MRHVGACTERLRLLHVLLNCRHPKIRLCPHPNPTSARCVNLEQGYQCAILAFYQSIASRKSWIGRYFGDLRGFHQFLCNCCSELWGIVGLHSGRSAMSCKPFVQDELCSCLGIVLIMCTRNGLCKFGEMVDDDQQSNVSRRCLAQFHQIALGH